MKQKLQITILGSGTSTGVPVIGCTCKVCLSPKNHYKRSRSSILITNLINNESILVDMGPDLRQQILNNNITHLKNVFLTHTHADHCHGIDDLRAFCFWDKSPVKIFAKQDHLDELKERFAYIFSQTLYAGTKPNLELCPILDDRFSAIGLDFETMSLDHLSTLSSCLKIGTFVYATDFKRFSDKQKDNWRGKIHTMIASGIHFRPHSSHSNIEETLALFDDLEVKEGVINHLSHEVDADSDQKSLPNSVVFGRDGMKLEIEF